MKVTLEWLSEYVDIVLSPAELAEKLTMAGLEVETWHTQRRDFSGVISAKVLTVEKHPDADKLHLCSVDTGADPIQVVCGAPNVRPGMIAPFARVGAKLGQDFTIDARKVRGVQSFGMLCSEMELGLSDNADGLMELAEDTPIGVDMQELLGKPDTIYDIAITSNRPDCLSVIGIAREIAALTGQPLRKPEIQFKNISSEAISDYMRVDIRNAEKCARYSGRLIKNITIKPSPQWLVKRLLAVGVRAINNVVDITNYVMLETGQPLHAFDYRTLAGKQIIVRDATDKEPFTTLDDKQHSLTTDDLLICDGDKPVALAGVMGGLNSEVTPDTETVFLESAYFNPVTVRRTSTRLGLGTESSRRFERGSNPNGTCYAMDRAAQLMCELADAQVLESAIDNVARPIDPVIITVRTQRVNNLLGTRLTSGEMCNLLALLELQVQQQDQDGFTLSAPTFRPDLQKEVDIAEEVARLYGYNNIDFNMSPQIDQHQAENPVPAFRDKVREYLTGMGLMENVSYSLVSETFTKPFLAEGTESVALLNPMSGDMAVFRSSVLVSLLTNTAYNRNRQIPGVRIYEIGSAACKDPKDGYREWLQVGGVLAGVKSDNTWHGRQELYDFYDMKGTITALFKKCGIVNYQFGPTQDAWWDRQAQAVLIDGKTIGAFGKIAPAICSLFKIKATDVFAFYLNFTDLYANRTEVRTFETVSKYPSSPFDIALLVDLGVPIKDLQDVIRDSGGPYLKDVHLFDFYKGEQVKEGKKSIAFSLTFSSKERTLDDQEVESALKGVLQEIRSRFGAELRPG